MSYEPKGSARRKNHIYPWEYCSSRNDFQYDLEWVTTQLLTWQTRPQPRWRLIRRELMISALAYSSVSIRSEGFLLCCFSSGFCSRPNFFIFFFFLPGFLIIGSPRRFEFYFRCSLRVEPCKRAVAENANCVSFCSQCLSAPTWTSFVSFISLNFTARWLWLLLKYHQMLNRKL